MTGNMGALEFMCSLILQGGSNDLPFWPLHLIRTVEVEDIQQQSGYLPLLFHVIQ